MEFETCSLFYYVIKSEGFYLILLHVIHFQAFFDLFALWFFELLFGILPIPSIFMLLFTKTESMEKKILTVTS